MFSSSSNLKNKSPYIVLALCLSLAIHGVFVWFTPTTSELIQSGSPARMNVSMQWSEPKELSKLPRENAFAKSEINSSRAHKELKNKDIKPTSAKQDAPKSIKKEIKQIVSARKTQQESILPIKEMNVVDDIKTDAIKAISNNTESNAVPTEQTEIAKEQTEKPADRSNQSAENNKEPNKITTAQPPEITKQDEIVQTQDVKAVQADKTNDKKQLVRYQLGSNANPEPSYPMLARKRGWEGEVVLGVYVRPDGTIEHLMFVKSTDYGILNFEAYETVRTSWRFKPLENADEISESNNSSSENSIANSTYIEIPIRFTIANR